LKTLVPVCLGAEWKMCSGLKWYSPLSILIIDFEMVGHHLLHKFFRGIQLVQSFNAVRTFIVATFVNGYQ
jgi:hypothetical protein